MWTLSSLARGFVSRVSRKRGVGEKLGFSKALASDTTRCRSAISLPLVAGFGIKEKGAGL
jgi:tryptophan synthase alpha subunit